MKIATVTWTTYKNYGTMLQAYALQKYLQNIGYENEIISDKYIIDSEITMQPTENNPNVAICSTALNRIKKYLFHPLKLFEIICCMAHNTIKQKYYKKCIAPFINSQARFDIFKSQELRISSPIVKDDLHKIDNEYDVFLCGSDQIWSVLCEKFDGYFFLDFTSKPKISYAPSMGTTNIDEKTQDLIKKWLQNYVAISVRETESSLQLQNLTQRKVSCVCDPTLLHNRDFWHDFCKDVQAPKNKYLLCYFLSDNLWYFEYAENLSKYLNLQLLLIPSKLKYCMHQYVYKKEVGPKEFVALFKNANFVLTDSYHGSIFSVIFEKNFLYLKRFKNNDPNSENIRIDTLFGKLGLNDQIVDEKKFNCYDIKQINFLEVKNRLNVFISESENFIKHSIKECEHDEHN